MGLHVADRPNDDGADQAAARSDAVASVFTIVVVEEPAGASEWPVYVKGVASVVRAASVLARVDVRLPSERGVVPA